jgi:DnaK suppressor protein
MLDKTELKSFEEQLLARKAQIKRNLTGTSLELNEMQNLELKDEGDHASISAETAVDSAILEQQRKELAEIELALDKINHGTYGICEMCEEPIGLERLRVKPHARYCIACREVIEQNKR